MQGDLDQVLTEIRALDNQLRELRIRNVRDRNDETANAIRESEQLLEEKKQRKWQIRDRIQCLKLEIKNEELERKIEENRIRIAAAQNGHWMDKLDVDVEAKQMNIAFIAFIAFIRSFYVVK